jgi:hypothetical protein
MPGARGTGDRVEAARHLVHRLVLSRDLHEGYGSSSDEVAPAGRQ